MLLMMGTADELPQAPTEKHLFMEDMSEDQLATAVSILLRNLSNVQCIYIKH